MTSSEHVIHRACAPAVPLLHSYPLLERCILLQAVKGVLYTCQTPRQGQQQADHFVQVPDKHAEFLQLVGFADGLHGGLYLLTQSVVVLNVLLQTLSCLPQHLQLLAQALDQLLLQMQTEKCCVNTGKIPLLQFSLNHHWSLTWRRGKEKKI